MLTQNKFQATVIALPQNKGGSGKTTTAVNLGAELTRRGYTTLILDLDPQSDLSEGLGIERDADAEDARLGAAPAVAELPGRPALLDLAVGGRGPRGELRRGAVAGVVQPVDGDEDEVPGAHGDGSGRRHVEQP